MVDFIPCFHNNERNILIFPNRPRIFRAGFFIQLQRFCHVTWQYTEIKSKARGNIGSLFALRLSKQIKLRNCVWENKSLYLLFIPVVLSTTFKKQKENLKMDSDCEVLSYISFLARTFRVFIELLECYTRSACITWPSVFDFIVPIMLYFSPLNEQQF